MPTAAPPRIAAPRTTNSRRLGWLVPSLVIVLASLWIAQEPLLRSVARFALPRLARSHGFELDFDVLKPRFFGPLLLGNVRLRDARGTDLRSAQIELSLSSVSELFSEPRRVVRGINVRELSGIVRLEAPVAAGSDGAAEPRAWFAASWPRVIGLDASKVFISNGDRHLLLKDASLLLCDDRPGSFRAAEAGLWCGSWSKTLPALRGVTAWRDGTAYISDIALAPDAVIEMFSADLADRGSFSLKARAFGGSLYGEWTGGPRSTGALNAFAVSLAEFGRFLGLEHLLAGELGLLNFTFNGDPAIPADSQSSLRIEARDFSWEKRDFSALKLGASLSGRRLKIDELQLVQKANSATARGLLAIPAGDWRDSDISLDLDVAAKDVRALGALFGTPWNKMSGGLELQARIKGRAGEASGWLKARGWDLRAPGIPPGSLQADAVLDNGTAKIAGLGWQSGPNFVRASGEISLKAPVAYRGRLEARVREVSGYLENLGRFAPDWAREGGVLLFWDGDGTAGSHSGVVSLELVSFTGDLNPVPVNGKFAATYSPGNVYVSRLLLDRGPLSLSASCYLSGKGLSVQDIQLFHLRERLLRAEVFLPVSWPLFLEGKPWSQAFLPGGNVYAMVRSDDLRLGPLANLFGQDAVAEGRVDWKFDASGPWENPSAESVLAIDGFRAAFDSFALPDSRLVSKATLAAQRLEVSGELHAEKCEPVKATASIPLLGRGEDGGWRVLDRSKPAAAKLEIPAVDLENFAASKPMSGQLSGSVSLSGQLSAPVLDGAFAWKNVSLVPVDGLAPVKDFSGKFVFAGSSAKFDGAVGKVGEGTFALEGSSDFSDLLKVSASAKISGKNLGLVASDKSRFGADVDLAIAISPDKRSVSGDIALVGSRTDLSLSVAPFLAPLGAEHRPVALTPPFRVGGWLGDCDSLIRVHTGDPVQLSAGANATADVFITGLLRAFVPVGRIEFSGLQAALPCGPMSFSRASVSFTRELPWVPVLDFSGVTRTGACGIAATVWGSLGEEQIKLESEPELPPDRIALLLGTGAMPMAEPHREFDAVGESLPRAPELPPSAVGFTWELR